MSLGFDRRAFLQSLAALGVAPLTLNAQAPEPFNVLILGDSIAWGQGLLPKERWRTLLCDKLTQAMPNRSVVQITPFIHSGAVIGIGDHNELGGDNLYKGSEHSFVTSMSDDIGGEISSATPTVLAQLDRIATSSPPPRIDLCVVVASINDVSNMRWLDPLVDLGEIDRLIELHCHQHLLALLDRVRTICVQPNPNCICVAMSYYSILSNFSLDRVLTEGPSLLLSLFGDADAKTRGEVAKILPTIATPERLQAFVDRSVHFASVSAAAIHHAVNDANRLDPKAFYYATPGLRLEDALFTNAAAPHLWEVNGDGPDAAHRLQAEDDVKSARNAICDSLYPIGQTQEFCHVASIAHPDPLTARENYLPAIWEQIAGPLHLNPLSSYP